MDTITIFNIAAELWGIVICMFALVGLLLEKNQIKGQRRLRLCMEIFCIVLLSADIVACYYNGRSGTFAGWMVWIGNYLAFFVGYTYMSLFIEHLWLRLKKPGEKRPRMVGAVWLISILGVILLTASQFSDQIFYGIDESNMYHRSSGYVLSQILGLVGLAVCAAMLIRYRDRLETAVLWACATYFVLPLLATLAVIAFYGISFQNFAIVISTQIMFMTDIIEVAKKLDTTMSAYKRVSHAAELDAMTGLYNKTSGTERIQKFISSMKEDDSASLSFVDIDNFKQINDTYGHAVGDYWIEYVAKLLRDECGTGDVACRFGGDEYVMLLKGDDVENLREKMGRFTRKLRLKATERGQEVHCSAGVCLLRGTGYDADKCIRQADNALYDAKRHGKDTSAIYRVNKAGMEKLEAR